MNYSPSRNALLGVLGFTALLSVLVTAAVARNRGGGAQTIDPAPTHDNAASAGMVVAKDPKTGALRAPTAKEFAALRALTKEARGGVAKIPPVVERFANGTLAVTLDQSQEVYSVAAKGPSGKIRSACVPGDKVETTIEAAQKFNVAKTEILDEK